MQAPFVHHQTAPPASTETSGKPARRGRVIILGFVAAALTITFGLALQPHLAASQRSSGRIEFERRSLYSQIRVRRNGTVRSLIFVRDNGEEAYESQVNLRAPHILYFSYLKHMFASYLFKEEQKRVMIVGLGGGSMVHFLQKYDPDVKIEAVEIDPLVVELAERYFAVKQNDQVRLIIADAFDYLERTRNQYDTIYMDAFLKPSAGTDSTGVPLKLRTQQFYTDIQKLLTEDGMVVFNINPHSGLQNDIETIEESFPQTYVFALPGSQGVVVVGSMNADRKAPGDLLNQGKAVDGRLKAAFSFEGIARRLRQ